MMKRNIYRSQERGYLDHGWLKAFHSFSFGEFHNTERMGFHSLRVINEDRVDPGQGFGTHGHRDMEIITVLLKGELEHKDSMGNGSILKPGMIQYMSAGTGVRHSEINPSQTQVCHLLQIWIEPNQKGLPPRYEQVEIDASFKKSEQILIVSPDGNGGSIKILQNAKIYLAMIKQNQPLEMQVAPGKGIWIQVAEGSVDFDGETLNSGDAVSYDSSASAGLNLKFSAAHDSKALVFEL